MFTTLYVFGTSRFNCDLLEKMYSFNLQQLTLFYVESAESNEIY